MGDRAADWRGARVIGRNGWRRRRNISEPVAVVSRLGGYEEDGGSQRGVHSDQLDQRFGRPNAEATTGLATDRAVCLGRAGGWNDRLAPWRESTFAAVVAAVARGGVDRRGGEDVDAGIQMSYARKSIERMSGYVPGEQPKVAGLIKLNTNENPYPPSPRVLEALRAAIDGRLRLYPDPTASALRQKLGKIHGFDPEQIIIGNGCDDILNLCVRAFCAECEKLAYFWPSYSLYPVLAMTQGATQVELPLDDDFQIAAHPPLLAELAGVKLVFITQPNAPSGVWLQRVELQRVIEETTGVVVIDEAYVDFAADNCLDLARDYTNVVVARTFSKAFSFAGVRVGWAAGPPELIAALNKVKDSYNVSRLSQLGAEVTLDEWDYFQ